MPFLSMPCMALSDTHTRPDRLLWQCLHIVQSSFSSMLAVAPGKFGLVDTTYLPVVCVCMRAYECIRC